MPELTLIQIDKTEFERLYQQAHGGSKSAAREIDALCSGNESSACFLCNESLGNDPVFHQVMPEFGDINKLIAAPLCPVCRTLPKMVRTNRCISLLQKMYAARSGKNIRFGAPSRRPVIPRRRR